MNSKDLDIAFSKDLLRAVLSLREDFRGLTVSSTIKYEQSIQTGAGNGPAAGFHLFSMYRYTCTVFRRSIY